MRHKSLILSLMLVAYLISACEREEPARVQNAWVRTSRVEPEALQVTSKVVGQLRAKATAQLFPKIKGKLVRYEVKAGQRVEKDQVVALIDQDAIGFTYEASPVRSPIAGTVGETRLSRGDSVDTDTAIARVVDLQSMTAELRIPERLIAYVAVGDELSVSVDAVPGRAIVARVTEIDPVLDPKTQSIRLEASLSSQGLRLLPGMFAKAQIITEQDDDALMVPEEAVVVDEGQWYVFVVEGDLARRRAVDLGARVPGKVQVLQGLQAGDTIVRDGHQKLRDGSKISVLEETS